MRERESCRGGVTAALCVVDDGWAARSIVAGVGAGAGAGASLALAQNLHDRPDRRTSKERLVHGGLVC